MGRFSDRNGTFYTLGQEIPLPDRISAADKKRSDSLECGKNRLLFTMAVFFCAFGAIDAQLVSRTVLNAAAHEHIKPEENAKRKTT